MPSVLGPPFRQDKPTASVPRPLSWRKKPTLSLPGSLFRQNKPTFSALCSSFRLALHRGSRSPYSATGGDARSLPGGRP